MKDWVYGSEDFLKRMVQMTEGEDDSVNRRITRSKTPITVDDVLAATAWEYEVSVDSYCGFRCAAGGRDIAAYLCRRYTSATLAELSHRFGLTNPDSSSDLVKRGRAHFEHSSNARAKVKRIERYLELNPGSRA